MNEQEFIDKMNTIAPESEEQRNKIACALLGHSRIQTSCFGYYYCARCGAQLGDSLGSVYNADRVVVVGHNCETCRKNYAELDWKDKIYCPDPFVEEETGS